MNCYCLYRVGNLVNVEHSVSKLQSEHEQLEIAGFNSLEDGSIITFWPYLDGDPVQFMSDQFTL
jgi:hypothetical protein